MLWYCLVLVKNDICQFLANVNSENSKFSKFHDNSHSCQTKYTECDSNIGFSEKYHPKIFGPMPMI